MKNYFANMKNIYDRLCDEESKILFEARISYLFNAYIVMNDIPASRSEFLRIPDMLYEKDRWYSQELENKMNQLKPKGIIIFGRGADGQRTAQLVQSCGYKVSYYCDNYKMGEVAGIKILTRQEVVKKYKEYLVIIGSTKYKADMFIELVQDGFPYDYILLTKYRLCGIRGKQYFDVFEPHENEVFIDAGTYDGQTILDFIKWANGNYKKIYGFEPMSNMYINAKNAIEENHVNNVILHNCAVWNKNEELYFVENGMSSCRSEGGQLSVRGIDIDSIVGNDKVSFIKMDIEGSELQGLEGAKKTIKDNAPRLAICIYHKPMDIIDIPFYLLQLNPKYKFYIRRYTSDFSGEEVLYATTSLE